MSHRHGPRTAGGRRRLAPALALTASVAFVQVIGGLVSGSLALQRAGAITSGLPVLSAHVVADDQCLGAHSNVEHCTFQLEPVGHQSREPAHHA